MRNENCKDCKLDNVVPRTEKSMLCNLSEFQSYKPGIPPCGRHSEFPEPKAKQKSNDQKGKAKTERVKS